VKLNRLLAYSSVCAPSANMEASWTGCAWGASRSAATWRDAYLRRL